MWITRTGYCISSTAQTSCLSQWVFIGFYDSWEVAAQLWPPLVSAQHSDKQSLSNIYIHFLTVTAGKQPFSAGCHLWALSTATNRAWAIFVFMLLMLQLGSSRSAVAATCERSTQRQTEPEQYLYSFFYCYSWEAAAHLWPPLVSAQHSDKQSLSNICIHFFTVSAGKQQHSSGRHLWALSIATNRAWAIFIFTLLMFQLGSSSSALAATCERSAQRQTESGRSAARHWHQDEQTLSGRKIIKMGRGGFR